MPCQPLNAALLVCCSTLSHAVPAHPVHTSEQHCGRPVPFLTPPRSQWVSADVFPGLTPQSCDRPKPGVPSPCCKFFFFCGSWVTPSGARGSHLGGPSGMPRITPGWQPPRQVPSHCAVSRGPGAFLKHLSDQRASAGPCPTQILRSTVSETSVSTSMGAVLGE